MPARSDPNLKLSILCQPGPAQDKKYENQTRPDLTQNFFCNKSCNFDDPVMQNLTFFAAILMIATQILNIEKNNLTYLFNKNLYN